MRGYTAKSVDAFAAAMPVYNRAYDLALGTVGVTVTDAATGKVVNRYVS